jgi:3-hydroxyacyl-[acyl-carrier-protein] dehydratase
MTSEEIQKLIPHRRPFLFVDEIVAIDDLTIHGRTFIDPTFEFFEGHYPDFPVLPGVIQCEMTFQTAAVLISTLQKTGDGRVPVVARLNNTKFRRLVRPGETVDIHVSITDKVKEVYYLTGTVGVGTEISARMDFTVTAARIK